MTKKLYKITLDHMKSQNIPHRQGGDYRSKIGKIQND